MRKASILAMLITVLILSFSCRYFRKNPSDGKLIYKFMHRELMYGDSVYYKIDLKRPVFILNDSLDHSLNELNHAMESFLDTAAVYFWGTDTTGAVEIVKETGTSGFYLLLNNYRIMDTTNITISVVFETYSYALGAHGFTAITTFNFDLRNKKLLEIGDIIDFSKHENQVVLNQLLAKFLVDEQNCFDTEPEADKNFSRFALDPDNVVFFYEAYELGAYACGSAEIKIPKAELTAAGIFKGDTGRETSKK